MRPATFCLLLIFFGKNPSKEQITYKSYAEDFKRIADSTNSLPMSQRIKVFRSTFDRLYPGLYADRNEGELDGRVAKALSEFPSIRTAYDGVLHDFPEAFAKAIQRFRIAFPGFASPMPIYFVHSLGTRDGGTDLIAGREVMLFGADEIAQFHWDDSLQPFIIHELFHLEHSRNFSDCDQLWCSLWQEGLATYTAASLTQNASDHQLILDVPHPIRQDTDAHWQNALCWSAEHFDSTNKPDIKAGFNGGPLPSSFSGDPRLAELPSRFGYYIGLRVAAQAGRTRSLSQLDQLNNQTARPVVAQALADLMRTGKLSCPLPPDRGDITRRRFALTLKLRMTHRTFRIRNRDVKHFEINLRFLGDANVHLARRPARPGHPTAHRHDGCGQEFDSCARDATVPRW